MNEIHREVLTALREHGIEIPFPQRDLHIRSTVEDK
jgi:small-conductance mechanosensitive channel